MEKFSSSTFDVMNVLHISKLKESQQKMCQIVLAGDEGFVSYYLCRRASYRHHLVMKEM